MIETRFRHSQLAREKAQRNKKIKRFLLVGAAGGIGGVLIGLTGGLAAPLVAAGAGMIIGSGAAGLATTAGAAVLGTTFGVAGAGLAGYKMNKRVGAIEEFSVETLSEGLSLHCALVVSGWIEEDTSCEQAFEHQWRHLSLAREQYTLRYESKYLMELGKAMDYIMGFAVSVAIQQTLMETVLAGLVSAVAWPVAIVSAASVLDNPWNVCVARAAEVHIQLLIVTPTGIVQPPFRNSACRIFLFGLIRSDFYLRGYFDLLRTNFIIAWNGFPQCYCMWCGGVSQRGISRFFCL
ncbi:hypothetical protein COOONC_18690 [Cooperia oncophora]